MKIRFIFAAATMILASGSAVAQSNNNQDEVVKIERHAQSAYREGEVLVKFKTGSSIVQSGARSANVGGVNRALSVLGVTELEELMPLTGDAQPVTRANVLPGKHINDFDLSNLYRVRFDVTKVLSVESAIEKMKSLSDVEYAEPNYIVYALSDESTTLTDCEHYQKEPLYEQQWGHHPLKLPFLWQQPKLSDKRPVIAILDTGVDIEHPDLVDNIWTNNAEAEGQEEADDDNNGFADDLHGWDFVNQTGRISDWNGHGTHCAGIAAAVGKNGIGIAGANPDAFIMPITVMQSDGTGDIATIIKGIDYAVANGADVLSMSFGGYRYSIAEEQALAKAYNKAVLVAAAGNDGHDIDGHHCPNDAPMFPAALTFVLGIEASDEGRNITTFSNYDCNGPIFSPFGEEQLYNYELRAPGANIMSTYPGGRYKALNGTSMACPYVAGGIARLLQCKEYSSWEVLFGDLIHTRKLNGYGDVDFEAAYKITDTDRIPELNMVTYTLKDTIEGDGDGKADAGEIIAFYPTLRNEWGQAQNIKFSLSLGENEDPTIIEFFDNEVDFGIPLSSYGKNKSVNPLRFKVNDNCVDGRHIRLVMRATCDNIAQELVQEFTITAENGVEIGGMITENMTLYPNVHYIVTRPLAIPEGVTLTIKPGTVLKFKQKTGISVTGNFDCIGTPDSMIVFTSADLELSATSGFYFQDTIKYVKIENFLMNVDRIKNCILVDCVVKNCYNTKIENTDLIRTNIISNDYDGLLLFGSYADDKLLLLDCNIVSNKAQHGGCGYPGVIEFSGYSLYERYSETISGNIFNNYSDIIMGNNGTSRKDLGNIFNITYRTDIPKILKMNDTYMGSVNENIIRLGIFDMYHSKAPIGYGIVDVTNMLTRPSAEAHGIVWKVVVNGYDAQDEFEMLPPLGVGKHKFEVYFNRPMNKEAIPMIAMGVRPPYTSHAIAEEGSWNEEGTIYTAYLTITGKTGADGLNRIYVAEAEDDEYFEIPIENMRFNVQVAAAGSMATGLMAEAGLGKVSLTWETDEEDFEDLLGYNLYRYTLDNEGVSSDSIIVNPSVIEADETEFVDYDVVPGTTYYYVIKQLTTSLSSHALSNAVAATPLTAQKGDANGSMNVDVADVVTEVAYMTNQDPQPFIFEAADVNSDLNVNILDVVGTLNIILNPTSAGIASVNNTATYTVEDGILYVESPVALGGVQVRIAAAKGTEFSVLEGLDGFEQMGNWQSDEEYLFLAYSMVGRTIGAGKQPILHIGDDVTISQMVLSDAHGKNVLAINGNATGIGSVEAMQMTLPYPNPFSTQLTIPYIIGKEGTHQVNIVVNDLAGRSVYHYAENATFGEYTHTWTPSGNLAKGLYLVSLYVDGALMHTAKVVYER